jgi:PAS domain-containing protein
MNGENDTGCRHAEEGPRRRGLGCETLLEVTPDLVFRVDREGKVLDLRANDGGKPCVRREAIVDRNLHAALPPVVADGALRHIALTLDTGKVQVYEYRLPMPQGAVLDFEARIVVSGADEVLCLVQDVTEHKQAERSCVGRMDTWPRCTRRL